MYLELLLLIVHTVFSNLQHHVAEKWYIFNLNEFAAKSAAENTSRFSAADFIFFATDFAA